MNNSSPIQYTPLIKSILKEDWDSFQEIIQDCDINECSSDGSNALIEAIYHCKKPIVRKMIHCLLNHKELNIDQPDSKGLTALAIASRYDWNIVKELLKKGANPNVYTYVYLLGKSTSMSHPNKSWRKITPLSLAVWQSNKEMVEELLNHNAAVDMIGSLDITPLSMAARMDNIEMMDHLVQKAGACLNILPTNWRKFTNNPQKACPVALRKALKYGHADCVLYLIRHGCPIPPIIYRANQTFATPIIYVLQQIPTVSHNQKLSDSYILTAQILMNNMDFHPELADSRGRTALSYAAEKGLINLLPSVFTDQILNTTDKLNLTPLSYAILNDQDSSVHYLLEKGADPNCLVLETHHYKKIVLRNKAALIPAIQYAIQTGNFKLTHNLLVKGADLRCYSSEKKLFHDADHAKLPMPYIKKLLHLWKSQRQEVKPHRSQLTQTRIQKAIQNNRTN